MEIMLNGLIDKCCIVYIDDIIIFSNTFKEYLQHLQAVLDRLKMCNVVIKPAKCEVVKHEVEYLGNMIDNGQVKSMQSHINKVCEQKLPETITDVRAFCSMAEFYRKYIKNFAKIAKPLTNYIALPGKKKKIQLTPEAIKAFLELKKKLNESPVLVLPDFNKPFGLRTDASKYVIEAVLFQLNENGEKQLIAYGSRVISKTEQRYSASKREMLAIYYLLDIGEPI